MWRCGVALCGGSGVPSFPVWWAWQSLESSCCVSMVACHVPSLEQPGMTDVLSRIFVDLEGQGHDCPQWLLPSAQTSMWIETTPGLARSWGTFFEPRCMQIWEDTGPREQGARPGHWFAENSSCNDQKAYTLFVSLSHSGSPVLSPWSQFSSPGGKS